MGMESFLASGLGAEIRKESTSDLDWNQLMPPVLLDFSS